MNYLDDLNDSAVSTLAELGGAVSTYSPIPAAPSSKSPARHRRRIEAMYLLRLEHPLTTPRDVAHVLSLSRVPQLETGADEDGEASFCRLSGSNFDALRLWAAEHHPKWKYTKIHINLAHKDNTRLPMLGRDATLPQHRPSCAVPAVQPQYVEREFPVTYFFYGTLADPVRLARLFNLRAACVPQLRPGVCRDGKVRLWKGKYKALVDAVGESVEGHVLDVRNEEQESALRVYESDAYEVVWARCLVDGKEVLVRTFRFCGDEGELV